MMMIRLTALLGLVGLIMYVTAETEVSQFDGFFEARAALLVFVAPILILLVFQSGKLRFKEMMVRLRELRLCTNEKLRAELEELTPKRIARFSISELIHQTERHRDSMVRYGSQLLSTKYGPRELNRLMSQRLKVEDELWRFAYSSAGFLAKTAPYFGMLATVIGMIHLFMTLEDFSKISGVMAMAMLGTFYGLFSFLVIYAPLQKVLESQREEILQRNEMIRTWFTLIASSTDPQYMLEEVRVLGSLTVSPQNDLQTSLSTHSGSTHKGVKESPVVAS